VNVWSGSELQAGQEKEKERREVSHQSTQTKSDSRKLIYGASSELSASGREDKMGEGSHWTWQGRRLGAAHVPAAAVGGAAVAGGGADGAGPLQGEREVVELPLWLAAG